jgi:hypothetical protein
MSVAQPVDGEKQVFLAGSGLPWKTERRLLYEEYGYLAD